MKSTTASGSLLLPGSFSATRRILRYVFDALAKADGKFATLIEIAQRNKSAQEAGLPAKAEPAAPDVERPLWRPVSPPVGPPVWAPTGLKRLITRRAAVSKA